MKAYTEFSTKATPQSEKIPGTDQIMNSAGGYTWQIDDWARLDRFLVLGSEGGTYYIKQRALTRENAETVIRLIAEDGPRVVERVKEISTSGRAPKNDPALFVLALAMKLGDVYTRRLAEEALSHVARIGTHLFHFATFLEQFGGWGRLTRRAIANWYNDKDPDRLAYQVVKYQQRAGWSHRDLLRLSHAKPASAAHNIIFGYITGKDVEEVIVSAANTGVTAWAARIAAHESAKTAEKAGDIVGLIRDFNLVRESIPTKWLKSVAVWEALLEKMPMGAMIRNLGKMSEIGLLKPFSDASKEVVKRLGNATALKRARVHPLAVLIALDTYRKGQGVRGKLTWSPVTQIADALDEAFYLSFGSVEPLGKRVMLAIDISGSMTWDNSKIAGSHLYARDAAAALALVTARTEEDYMVTVFSSAGTFKKPSRRWWGHAGIVSVPLSPKMSLYDVMRTVNGYPAGGTDCSLPMLYALEEKLPVDVFIVYTDNETWAGSIHPAQALKQYRAKTGILAKLVVVGMTSNGFTIADPNDEGMLDVVGFDAAAPSVISDFGR